MNINTTQTLPASDFAAAPATETRATATPALPAIDFAAIRPLLNTDGYKTGHIRQYPQGTTRVYSNYTNRGSRMTGVDQVVHFGLQAAVQELLIDAFASFFAASEDTVAGSYQQVMDSYLGPGVVNVDHIRALHRLGYLPLQICALPEGTRVPLKVPVFTIENTLPEFFWLTNYVESALSAAYWHPSTSATIAAEFRRVLDQEATLTTGNTAGVDFQAHDFSFRGQTSIASAEASAAGHLLSFLGTDSLPAIAWIDRYYPGSVRPIAASVPATEHSVMMAGGREHEDETYARLLAAHPTGILSVVSDTWDLWRVLTQTLPGLREQIMGREGKLVIRPDSGDPIDILCGTEAVRGAGVTPAEKGVVEILWDQFGGTTTAQGFDVLDEHIGAIYGDSITLDRMRQIIDRLKAKGFASTNVVFGIGSFTYQYQTRDTFASAIKATWAEIDGVGHDLLKDPITDNGTKKSATGRLAVIGDNGTYRLIEQATSADEARSALTPIFLDGHMVEPDSFDQVRDRIATNS